MAEKFEYLVRRLELKWDHKEPNDFILSHNTQSDIFLAGDKWSGHSYQEYLNHLGSKGWQLIRVHEEKRRDHNFGYDIPVILTFIRRYPQKKRG